MQMSFPGGGKERKVGIAKQGSDVFMREDIWIQRDRVPTKLRSCLFNGHGAGNKQKTTLMREKINEWRSDISNPVDWVRLSLTNA
jgi:hypothetical protein